MAGLSYAEPCGISSRFRCQDHDSGSDSDEELAVPAEPQISANQFAVGIRGQQLYQTAQSLGRWYKILADNFYCSLRTHARSALRPGGWHIAEAPHHPVGALRDCQVAEAHDYLSQRLNEDCSSHGFQRVRVQLDGFRCGLLH
jgi:hypothetical protein